MFDDLIYYARKERNCSIMPVLHEAIL